MHLLRTFLFFAFSLSLASLSPLAHAGDYDSEIAKQKNLLAQNPNDSDAAYQLGNYLAWDQRYEEALHVFEEILAKNPSHKDAIIGIAQVYAWKGDPEKATQKYEEILAGDPKNFLAYQGLGLLSLWNQDYEKSIRSFKQALDLKPDDLTSLYGIGRAYLGRGDPKQADAFMAKAKFLEWRQKKLPIAISVVIGVLAFGALIFYWIRSQSARQKRTLLQLELKVLRYALALYLQMNGKPPLAIENLAQETWQPPGELEGKPYLEGMRQNKKGVLLDPFGNRYWYNPDTGGIYSSTKGYEEW